MNPLDEENAEYERIFNMLDRDNDGKISEDDLNQACMASGLFLGAEELRNFFVKMDPKEDKKIDLTEFKRAMAAKVKKAIPDEALSRIFVSFDCDGDGFLSAREIHKGMIGLGDVTMTFEEAQGMIRDADTDGDGLLNFEEFKAVMNKGT